jgi:hypothetical protein
MILLSFCNCARWYFLLMGLLFQQTKLFSPLVPTFLRVESPWLLDKMSLHLGGKIFIIEGRVFLITTEAAESR